MTISWAWAWTPVPAVFVVHDLELSGQNPRRQWALAVDRAIALIDPLALRQRSVRSRWLHASGVGADLRPRQPPAEPAAAPRGSGRPPWTLVLDGIDVPARKPIRFNQFHLQGDGGIRGSVWKVMRGPFAADSLRLEIANGELSVDSEPIAHQLELVADLAIAPFVPREHRGRELRFVSATAELQGELLRLGSLTGKSSIELRDGAALSGNLRIAAGKLAPGSRIGLETPHLDVRLAGWTAAAAAAVAAEVEAEGDGIRTRVNVELKDLKLRER
ncbi:MAG: hypothetical protein GY841_13835, partial [FCB group bacterium]|nr:hypothetical protein [FCB group bacterium]